MRKVLTLPRRLSRVLSALTGSVLCFPAPLAFAENLANEQTSKSEVDQSHIQPLGLKARSQVLHDTYILGPGDRLEIDLLDLPELSGVFSIGPDGSIYLPRLRALYVEGLTVEELRNLLTKQFRKYVLDPQVYVRPVSYRQIRIYVGGEVQKAWLLHAQRRSNHFFRPKC